MLTIAGRAQAGDFYTPTAFTGQAQAVSIGFGESQCYTFSLASTTQRTFSLSANAVTCQPIDGVVVLYPGDANDPTMWMAQSPQRLPNSCSVLHRRLTAGAYQVCVGGLAGRPAQGHLLVTDTAGGSTPTNDTCASPTLIMTTSNSYSATSQSLGAATHDMSPMPIGACSGMRALGPERIWSFTLLTGKKVTVTMTPTTGDPTIYLLSDCGDWWKSCVAATANPAGLTIETLQYTNNGPPSTFFLVVDTNVQVGANFHLNVTRTP